MALGGSDLDHVPYFVSTMRYTGDCTYYIHDIFLRRIDTVSVLFDGVDIL